MTHPSPKPEGEEKLTDIEAVALVDCPGHWSKRGERCNVRVIACSERKRRAEAIHET